MGQYEYKVLPTPSRAKRTKGVKGEPARFAHTLTELMNEQAAEGWEFFKSEALPMETKSGMFKSREETFQSLLVFRRALTPKEPVTQDEILSFTPAAPVSVDVKKPDQRKEPLIASKETPLDDGKTLTFDQDDIDPLKDLVKGHQKNAASE